MKPNPGMNFKRAGLRKWVASHCRHHWGCICGQTQYSILCLFCYRRHKEIMVAALYWQVFEQLGFLPLYESFSAPEFLKMVAHSPSSSFSVCPFYPKLTFSTAKQEQQWQIMFWKKGAGGGE